MNNILKIKVFKYLYLIILKKRLKKIKIIVKNKIYSKNILSKYIKRIRKHKKYII